MPSDRTGTIGTVSSDAQPARPVVRGTGAGNARTLDRGGRAEVDAAPGTIAVQAAWNDAEHQGRRARERMDLAKLEWLQSERPEVRTLLALGEAAADLGEPATARNAFAAAIRIARRGRRKCSTLTMG